MDRKKEKTLRERIIEVATKLHNRKIFIGDGADQILELVEEEKITATQVPLGKNASKRFLRTLKIRKAPELNQ